MYCTAPGSSFVFTTQFCTIEAQMVIEGSQLLLGIKYASVPGTNFQAKRANINSMTIDELRNIIQVTGGFFCHLKAEDFVYLIPSGYLLVTVSEGAKCLRWGVSGDGQDHERVKHMATATIESFPEFNNHSQPLGHFSAWLQDTV